MKSKDQIKMDKELIEALLDKKPVDKEQLMALLAHKQATVEPLENNREKHHDVIYYHDPEDNTWQLDDEEHRPIFLDYEFCDDCKTVKHDSEAEFEYLNGFPICYSCLEYAREHNPHYHSLQDNLGTRYIGDDYGFYDEEGGNSTPPVNSVFWKSTDAWRGYWDHKLQDGWREISGWSTGYPDHTVSRKAEFNNVYEQLMADAAEGTFPPHLNIWICTAPTSNVFSTSVSIIFREKDREAFAEYLSERFEVDLEDISAMLG